MSAGVTMRSLLRRHVDDGHALLLDVLFDRADRARHGHERTGRAFRVLDEEEGDRLAVRRLLRLGEIALHARDADGRAANARDENLALVLAAVADGGDRSRVRRPRDVVIVAVAGQKMNVHATGCRRRHTDALDRPRDMVAVW